MATLYDLDFHAWTVEQSHRLRSGSQDFDAANIAEEIEALGRAERQQLINRTAVLVQHMLKVEYQLEKRISSWDATIKEQRRRVNRLLDENPSLRPQLANLIADAYPTAVTFASAETGIVEEDFPLACPYSELAILNVDLGAQGEKR